MKNLFLLLLILIVIFSSCRTEKKEHNYLQVKQSIIDSFSVDGLEELPEDLMRFSFFNDSTIFTLTNGMKEVSIFKDTDNSKRFFLNQKESTFDSIEPFIIFMKGYKEDNKLHLILGDYSSRRLNIYNQKFKLLKSNHIEHKLPHLSDKYFFTASSQLHPAYIKGDTLITGITINDPKQFDNYYADDMFMKFIINQDSISFKGTFGKYAAGVRNYYPPISFYTWGHGYAWIAYPAFDTIFAYNIETGASRKIPIRNPDFIPAEKWVDPPHNDPNYFSKLSRYNTENFKYQGIVFDPHSGNLVLWYQKPHMIKKKNGILKTEGEGIWYIIVISEQGKLLRSYKIEKHKYFQFIFQTPRGLAIPRYQNNLTHEKTLHFDIVHL